MRPNSHRFWNPRSLYFTAVLSLVGATVFLSGCEFFAFYQPIPTVRGRVVDVEQIFGVGVVGAIVVLAREDEPVPTTADAFDDLVQGSNPFTTTLNASTSDDEGTVPVEAGAFEFYPPEPSENFKLFVFHPDFTAKDGSLVLEVPISVESGTNDVGEIGLYGGVWAMTATQYRIFPHYVGSDTTLYSEFVPGEVEGEGGFFICPSANSGDQIIDAECFVEVTLRVTNRSQLQQTFYRDGLRFQLLHAGILPIDEDGRLLDTIPHLPFSFEAGETADGKLVYSYSSSEESVDCTCGTVDGVPLAFESPLALVLTSNAATGPTNCDLPIDASLVVGNVSPNCVVPR